MPVSWRLADGILWLESGDQPTVRDWQDALDAVLAHPRYRPGTGLIYDRRRAVRVPASQEVRAAVAYVSQHAQEIGSARWAVVVSQTATYGMGRMAGSLLDGTSVTLSVFHDLAEAEAWVRGTNG